MSLHDVDVMRHHTRSELIGMLPIRKRSNVALQKSWHKYLSTFVSEQKAIASKTRWAPRSNLPSCGGGSCISLTVKVEEKKSINDVADSGCNRGQQPAVCTSQGKSRQQQDKPVDQTPSSSILMKGTCTYVAALLGKQPLLQHAGIVQLCF